jgi:hypothetical protein
MSGSLTVNPYATTNVQNSFLANTQGYVQGFAMDDPAARMELTGAVLASTETLVMWGGVPLTELINITGSGSEGLGPQVKRATASLSPTAWSVYNQAHSMLIVPGPSAPAVGVGGYVGFFRTGSNARIAVACDPALVSTIADAGDNVGSLSLFWDVTNFRITLTTGSGNFALPASTRLLSVNSNSKIITVVDSAPQWAAGDAAIILI